MYPEFIELNKAQFKVIYDRYPWVRLCALWAVYFIFLYIINHFVSKSWLVMISVSGIILLVILCASLTDRYIKKVVFIFDINEKTVYRNGERYISFDDIKSIYINVISGDLDYEYQLLLKHTRGKMLFGRTSEKVDIDKREAQLRSYIKTV
jgi:hypothetical protein